MTEGQNQEKQNKQQELTEQNQENVRLNLRRAREIVAEKDEDLDTRIGELFREGITDDMVEQEKSLLRAWSRSVRLDDGTHKPFTIPEVTDETATTAIAMKRARNFWRQGLSLAEEREDIDTWLQVTSTSGFAATADRAAVYPKESLAEHLAPGARFGINGANGFELYDTVLRIGGDDREYLRKMAARISELAASEDESGVNPVARSLANGFVKKANSLTKRDAGNVKVSRQSFAPVDKDQLDPAHFLAHEVFEYQQARENARPIRTPSEALARLEFMVVNPEAKEAFGKLGDTLPDVLIHKDTKNRQRESLDFVRGASRLLFSSLEFAGKSQENAAKMHTYLEKTGIGRGLEIVPSRRAIVALANQISPFLESILEDNDLKTLTTDTPFDTFRALDRLFAFVEHEALQGGDAETAETLDAVADCALQLAAHGVGVPYLRAETPSDPKIEEPHAEKPGPRARVRAAYQLRRPGHGKLS
jgi:hypothetical protein